MDIVFVALQEVKKHPKFAIQQLKEHLGDLFTCELFFKSGTTKVGIKTFFGQTSVATITYICYKTSEFTVEHIRDKGDASYFNTKEALGICLKGSKVNHFLCFYGAHFATNLNTSAKLVKSLDDELAEKQEKEKLCQFSQN